MRAHRASPLSELKLKTPKELKRIISSLKARGKTIVFTNGCFDLLHYGHVKYLEDAKKKGDILVVAINSDASIRRIKGSKRPFVGEKDRQKIIAALEAVDYAIIFDEDTPLQTIKLLKPDILVKGADWKKERIVGADYILRYGGRVSTIKFVKNRSTTNLIKKIASTF